MRQTNDLHVVATRQLLSPNQVKEELPLTGSVANLVATTRDRIRGILRGDDQRLLVVVGPCSIHDVKAAREYGEKLQSLRQELSPCLEVVMRVYFEKPRTNIGWKGLINDPWLDESFDINSGLRLARQLLLDLADLGLPAATELLDPIIPQYIADLVSWTAIGARTTESQTHREMASGLSMPVGFKNGTDGDLDSAINAMMTARRPHHFLGINAQGLASIVTTTGNPDTHLVLRGGKQGPNYTREQAQTAASTLRHQGCLDRVMVDCSHGNSGKDPEQQVVVAATLAQQLRQGAPYLLGVMLESHLVGGKQSLPRDPDKLVYGQSITDGCLDFLTTAQVLRQLAQAAGERVLVNASVK